MRQIWKDPAKAHVSARMSYTEKVTMLCEASYEFLHDHEDQMFTIAEIIMAVKAKYPATEELIYNLVYDQVEKHLINESGVFNIGGTRSGRWTVCYTYYNQSSYELTVSDFELIKSWFIAHKKKLRSRKAYWIFGLNTLHWCKYCCTGGRDYLRFYFAVPVRVSGSLGESLIYDIHTQNFAVKRIQR